MSCVNNIPTEVKARRIVQCPGDDPVRVTIESQPTEFDHTILCEFDQYGELTGRKVVIVISYSNSGIPTTGYYDLSTGETYLLPEGNTLSACVENPSSVDVEMKEMCDYNAQTTSSTQFIRWFVMENGAPTGVFYDTDYNGQPYTMSLLTPTPQAYEYDYVTFNDDNVNLINSPEQIDNNFDDGDGTTGYIDAFAGSIYFSTVNPTNFPGVTAEGLYQVVAFISGGEPLPDVPNTPTFGTCAEAILQTFVPTITTYTGASAVDLHQVIAGYVSFTITVISGSVTVSGAGVPTVLPEGSSFTWTAPDGGFFRFEGFTFTTTGSSETAEYIVHGETKFF